ncbi:la-related protein 7-like isoform X1 [Trichoplusia ni]|uniref:La-related protein 7 n=1 Tax=Trichoplusia ni TaxID=7111 RepID=A0A7E5VYS1_TRINI|nr:la-related protein 7-like isoform X1 [Trichoplusia ni]XP_026733263.1 la-related protein 7-like isoform X1 [Trichoplusia ni]
MSESESADVVDQEVKHEHSPRKRIRHRKKQLYENILKQMEFYFSDANLTKDRFLADLVKRNPYVPLDMFLKFNKIRTLTQDVTDIAKAMKNSKLLELTEDKLKIKRKTAVAPYDADSRTVYVESIPVTASREWLQRVFSDYGHVAYISLPKFKNSQKIKGFAFIEFDKPEDAQKCINTFTKMGCKLPTCMPPEELSSIKMFSVDEPSDDVLDKEVKEDYEPPKKKKKKDKKMPQKSLELKLGSESDSEKRVETPTPTDENKSIASVTTPTEENKLLDLESKDELTSHDEGKEGDTPRKKKARKRTAKERSKAKNNLSKNEAPRGALWGLQVLSKSEWKALRNKYLNLQRKYMKEMKANLHNKKHQYSSIPAPAAASVEVDPGLPSAPVEGSKSIASIEKVPGLFVKEILPEPCLDVRLTKRTIRSNVHALHVNVKEGQTEAIIRFDTPKAAEEYCSGSGRSARVVSGAEEQAQWALAEGALLLRRPRGRCRLLAEQQRAARPAPPALAPASPQPTHTHIRFEDE